MMLGGRKPIAARPCGKDGQKHGQDSTALYGRGWSITFKPFGPVVVTPRSCDRSPDIMPVEIGHLIAMSIQIWHRHRV
jgi:hypothetical protein